jgi:uncharacterized protein
VQLVGDRLLTPSKITAWLDCAHFLTLRHQVDDGTRADPGHPFGSLAQLLVDKGLQHEHECLEQFRDEGRSVLEVAGRERGETFEDWVTRVGNPLEDGHDVIYQMPFVHQGLRGVADFLVRAEDDATGASWYEPVDAKLSRTEAKPGHVLQLCFYTDALEAMTGSLPVHMHLWLGSGRIETLVTAEFRSYWRRLRQQLEDLLDADVEAVTTAPEPCDHCGFCEFASVCEDEWRDTDSLVYVAGLRRADRGVLVASGVETLAGLAELDGNVEVISPERLGRLVGQASLQVAARHAPEDPPPFELIEPTEDPTWGRGFEQLPEPDDGDVFLDIEGHPFWQPDAGLVFLFGLIRRGADDSWTYEPRWAHDRAEEAAVVGALIADLATWRADRPGMHVYHYNHTERSALQRLAADHGAGEAALQQLVETGLFVDLLTVASNAVQVGTESYGLKHLERLTGFVRGHDIDAGAGAVVEYEAYLEDREVDRLGRIAAYNEDDVRATLALQDWLVDHRPADIDWRAAVFDAPDAHVELDEQVAALHAFPEDSGEHVLGDVLGYWLREYRAYLAPRLAKLGLDHTTLLGDPETTAGLECVGEVMRYGVKGKELKHPAMVFKWPPQVIGRDLREGGKVLFLAADGHPLYADVCALDEADRELHLLWNDQRREDGTVPTVVVSETWVPQRPKPAALSDLAAQVIGAEASGEPNPASVALLRRDLPSFVHGAGPPNGTFGDGIAEMQAWVTKLDGTVVAIQGPPGTGKTYSGAHLVLALVRDGQRVGITAMSHRAIDNMLEEVIDVFAQAGALDLLAVVRRGKEPNDGGLDRVTYAATNAPCAKDEFNVVAGTTWLFAGNDMADAPVDVLVIDEAGQLALADALAAARSARNLLLLGDPLQLPQVSLASHPGSGGRSVLEHAIGRDATIQPDRGVFLSVTRRLHPDVCRFISEQIYEERLTSHESCAVQRTEAGTGLRWLQAHHVGCSTESVEEAELIAAEIARLVGTTWVNQDGDEAALGAADFMVVAPYNDQVNLLRARLDANDACRGVPVGTVDKFQGGEAAVVFFTMTTSTAQDMPRGSEFLFSRNRLNVAVSRARCLAYLVCTEELLNSRARTVEEMRLISTLAAFVEYAP